MQSKHSNLTLKFSALAGVAVSAASSAQAAIVPSSTVGSGISPPATTGSFFWDVDGDSTNDFRLLNGPPGGSFTSIHRANFDDANGGRLFGELLGTLRPTSAIEKLNAGAIVASNVPGFGFNNYTQSSVQITYAGGIGDDAFDNDWRLGNTGYFGFKFTSGSDDFFGWGTLSITGTPQGQGFTITEAYYENTPGASIEVGATSSIPEPASAAALLGLGAVGIAAWRRRRPVAA